MQGLRNHPRQRPNGPVGQCVTSFCSERVPLCRCQGVMEVTRFFVPGHHDLWPWNSSERGTKHVSPVNLAQIRSAIPEIFDAQTNKWIKCVSRLARRKTHHTSEVTNTERLLRCQCLMQHRVYLLLPIYTNIQLIYNHSTTQTNDTQTENTQTEKMNKSGIRCRTNAAVKLDIPSISWLFEFTHHLQSPYLFCSVVGVAKIYMRRMVNWNGDGGKDIVRIFHEGVHLSTKLHLATFLFLHTTMK